MKHRKIKIQGPHENQTENESEKILNEIVSFWGCRECREVGDAVKFTAFLPIFIYMLNKGIIVNFRGTKKPLEVQGEAPIFLHVLGPWI